MFTPILHNDPPLNNCRYITDAELRSAFGLTPRDLGALYPQIVEYRGPDGRPCWLRDEVAEWLAGGAH